MQPTCNKDSPSPVAHHAAEAVEEKSLGCEGSGLVQQLFLGGELDLLGQQFSPAAAESDSVFATGLSCCLRRLMSPPKNYC